MTRRSASGSRRLHARPDTRRAKRACASAEYASAPLMSASAASTNTGTAGRRGLQVEEDGGGENEESEEEDEDWEVDLVVVEVVVVGMARGAGRGVAGEAVRNEAVDRRTSPLGSRSMADACEYSVSVSSLSSSSSCGVWCWY